MNVHEDPTRVRPNSSVILGKNVRIAPGVYISDGAWIGDNVVLGHPRRSNLWTIAENEQNSGLTPVYIGPGCIIRSGTVIYEGVRLGKDCDVAHDVLIREDAVLGDDCYVMPKSEIHAGVRIGRGVRIRGFLCNRSMVGDESSILGLLVHGYRSRRGGVIEPSPRIGRNTVVGMNAIIIGDIEIGDGATVGAGSVVTRSVPPGWTVVGNPARLHVTTAGASGLDA